MGRRPRVVTLVLVTLLPCALVGLRWYSFHGFDYLLCLADTTGYSLLLSDGLVQCEVSRDFQHKAAVSGEHEWICDSLYTGHWYDSDSRVLGMKVILTRPDFPFGTVQREKTVHDVWIAAYGSNNGIYDYMLTGPFVLPVHPAAPLYRYVQFPLWPWMGITAVLAARKWWRFWRAGRRRPAFPVEIACGVSGKTA